MKSGYVTDDPIRILYLIRDGYPTFRVDIEELFGRFLPEIKIETTIVAARNRDAQKYDNGLMEAISHRLETKSRYDRAIWGFFCDFMAVLRHQNDFHIIQVRNKILLGAFCGVLARLRKFKFCYWMSFPYPEDDLIRVREHGFELGAFRSLAVFLRGIVTKILLYKIVLPLCDHVFVQSNKMAQDVMRLTKMDKNRLSVVPMAVNVSAIEKSSNVQVDVPAGNNIVYLGAMDRTRKIEFLFAVLHAVMKEIPDTHLILVGDCIEKDDWIWLECRAAELGVLHKIIKTGWLERELAWSYLSQADVGVCALPDKFTFNSMSPTKAVEMLAIGLPSVVTEHPDQGALVRDSGGGFVTGYDVNEFADAVCKILVDKKLGERMGTRGQRYIKAHRCYRKISEQLRDAFKEIVEDR